VSKKTARRRVADKLVVLILGRWPMLIFLVGVLLGALFGATLCVRYLRQEIAANVGPRLRQIQLQLDSLQAELNLALTRIRD
jgi:uncharacterized membrane-anchored protein YhcB (DUF1043 family)